MLEKFSSIAHGNGEPIVGGLDGFGNLERGRAGERDMRIRDVGGVTRTFCVHPYDLPGKEIQGFSVPSPD
jgi:hypothetical protein